MLAGYGDPDLWIAGIGAYGYDWTDGEKEAETITFADAMSRASYSGLAAGRFPGADVQPDLFLPGAAKDHTVCISRRDHFSESVARRARGRMGVSRFSRLGQEDPQIWDVLAMKDTEDIPPEEIEKLNHMQSTDTISQRGPGRGRDRR